MFHPLPIFLGLRYVRTRGRGFFVSFISWVSMLGVCLGVAALITIISVMNGFEGELRGRLVALTAHATVSPRDDERPDWTEIGKQVRRLPGVAGAAPFVDVQAMLGRAGALLPAVLHGIEPDADATVAQIEPHLLEGRIADLTAGSRRMIIGRVLAWQLGVEVGDELTVMVPGRSLLAAGGRPVLQTFVVTGVFEVGLQDHDGSLALVALEDAAGLAGGEAGPAGLRLRFDDVMRAPQRAAELRAALSDEVTITDWTQDHAAYFRAIRI